MTKTEKRLNRWTEKMEIIDGVVVRFLKPPYQCRPKKAAKIAKKEKNQQLKEQNQQLQNQQEAS